MNNGEIECDGNHKFPGGITHGETERGISLFGTYCDVECHDLEGFISPQAKTVHSQRVLAFFWLVSTMLLT